MQSLIQYHYQVMMISQIYIAELSNLPETIEYKMMTRPYCLQLLCKCLSGIFLLCQVQDFLSHSVFFFSLETILIPEVDF